MGQSRAHVWFWLKRCMQITNSMRFRMEILPVAFFQHVEWNSLPDLWLHIIRAETCWFKNRKISPGSPNKYAWCICSFKIISLKKQKPGPGIRQSSIAGQHLVNKELTGHICENHWALGHHTWDWQFQAYESSDSSSALFLHGLEQGNYSFSWTIKWRKH